MSSVFSTAISGMQSAVSRLSNAATNIANISSTGQLPREKQEKATSFEPKDVINLTNATGGVSTTSVLRDPSYFPLYDPHSPNADESGLVAAPNVDLVAEITDSILAEIAYKANIKAIQAEKENEENLIDTLA